MNYTFALQLLIEVTQREIDQLELSHKLFDQNKTVAPSPVRKAARRREQLIEAVQVVKNGR